MKKYDYKSLLTSGDIIDIGKKHFGIDIQVYSRDAGPSIYPVGFYVINLDDSSGGGTHWQCFIKPNNDEVLYFDSFGFPAPVEQLQSFSRDYDRVFYNKRQIQDIKSILCGYYCLGLFKYFTENGYKQNVTEPLQNYVSLFSDNPKKNDTVLKKYLGKL